MNKTLFMVLLFTGLLSFCILVLTLYVLYMAAHAQPTAVILALS